MPNTTRAASSGPRSDRRAFLRSVPAALGACALGVPAAEAAGPQPPIDASVRGAVKVTDVRAYRMPQATFVEVVSDAGVSGWGECAGDNNAVMEAFVNEGLEEHVIGQDPFDAERLWDWMFFENHDLGPGGALPNAIAGVDIALWDLKGRLLNLPIYKLIGGKYRDRVKMYGSFGVRRGKVSKEEAVRIAAKLRDRGCTAFKLRMQIREHYQNIDPDPTFEYARAVREVIGKDTPFWIDANNGYTAARAIEVGKRLREEFGIAYFEDPISDQNHREMAQVVAALDVPIIAGEKEYTRWQVRELIVDGNVDILNPDIAKAGGITEMKKIAAIAQAFSKPIMAHNTYPTIGTAATMHFVASIPNAAPYLEFVDHDRYAGVFGVMASTVKFQDGYYLLPEGPGLGVEVVPEAVRKAARR
jgi:L-alanine-DL-glutamate epimerase-like enolase superfamily enzyme